MPEFQLVSDFQPTGDQPQAIEKLASGLVRGLEHQTLLGVTGSGKSVVANTTVLVRRRVRVTREPIGPLIDGLLSAHAEQVRWVGDTELLEPSTADQAIEAYSFNPQTGQASWKPVAQLLRHRSPEWLARVSTACGRTVTVTGDHNFFTLRDGELRLLRTEELQAGDYLPLPRQLPEPSDSLVALDLEQECEPDDRAYVAVQGFQELWTTHKAVLEPILSGRKAWALRNKEERLPLATYRQLEQLLPSMAEGAEFGSIKRTYSTPGFHVLTPGFLRLLGYYVAEGHGEESYFILSAAEAPVVTDLLSGVAELGLRAHHHPSTYDYQISSRLWARLLARWCGRDARSKQLPPFWADLSNADLAELLRAYFTADGGVEHDEVTCTTASEQLASDLGYALLRFGIIARLRARWQTVPGHLERRLYWRLSISGSEFLTRFADAIGFVLPGKTARLQAHLAKQANTNVDVVPLHGPSVRSVRVQLGLSQRQLAERSGCTRTALSLIENGYRRPSRTLALAVIGALGEVATARRDPSARETLERLDSLLHLFWTPVRSVTSVAGERYVYDFAVADNETFLAGTGGLFVHNTFTMANVVQRIQRPTLVIAHNKTLAAQLASEFKEFFPNNAVEYFVSYYDYYQPEAYIPRTDTYIEKDSLVNEDIERLRHSTMQSLLTRRDVLVVASVSCIYGLGAPEDYGQNVVRLRVGESYKRDRVLRRLIDVYYERNDFDLSAGKFRVRGDTLEVHPASQELVVRISFWGDEVEKIAEVDPLTGEVLADRQSVDIYPARYFVTPKDKLDAALGDIQLELDERVRELELEDKLLEAQRLRQRTHYDLEMMAETGVCPGVENYSRHLQRREPGSIPWTLMDYFPDDFLCFVDESHMTVPQVRGMFNGDRARKTVLVDFGFRLPSALDNRPLMFHEFERHLGQVVYVSATPGPYELSVSRVLGTDRDVVPLGSFFEIPDWELVGAQARETRASRAGRLSDGSDAGKTAEGPARASATDQFAAILRDLQHDGAPAARTADEGRDGNPGGRFIPTIKVYGAEQLVRPTGLLDPEIEVKPTRGQIDDLMEQIQRRVARSERVLVTTLTKRMAEDLADFLREAGVKVHYLHSEVDTLDRIAILRDLRLGVYDVVVGINLLREGLDLPEVSLVAILDADKEGYLRSTSALIQTIGRAARHVDGRVMMYADQMTFSMQRAIEETYRRRQKQQAYNQAHGIAPMGIRKAIRDIGDRVKAVAEARADYATTSAADLPRDEVQRLIRDLESQMKEAAKAMEFEKAALLRDQVVELKRTLAADEPERVVPAAFTRPVRTSRRG